MNAKFSGYVLAGGKSSRMGTDKALLEFAGETFLGRAARALENVCENRVKAILNHHQINFIERLPAGVSHLFDIFENRGAPGALHAALLDCRTEFAIILACDLPFVTSEAIEKLAEISLSSEEFSAVIPRQTDNRLQPLCAVYSAKKCLPEIEKILQNEFSPSMKDFLKFIPAFFVEIDKLTVSDKEKIFFNVNRPADFQKLKIYDGCHLSPDYDKY